MNFTQLLTAIWGSPTVYRIGWALIHSLWLGAAVAAALAAVLVMFRRRSANARYLAGCAALVATVVLVLGAFMLVQPPAEQASRQDSVEATPILPEAAGREAKSSPKVTPGRQDASAARTDGLAPSPRAFTPAPADPEPAASRQTASTAEKTPKAWTARVSAALEPALPWVVSAWSAGVCVLLVWHLGGWLAVGRLRRQARQLADSGLVEVAARLARALRVSRPVRLLESALVRVPTVAGCLQPAVLLPVSLATGLTPEQIEAILAHELAHIRRWDYLANLLQSLVETLFFYHPAVWWMSRRIRAERENACDDLAVAIGQERSTYAESLARTAEMARAGRQGAGVLSRVTVGAAGRPSGLRDRIFRLLEGEGGSRVRFPWGWPGALATAAGILCLALLLIQAAAGPNLAEQGAKKRPKIAIESEPTPVAGKQADGLPIRAVADVFESLKAELVRMGGKYPQLAAAGEAEVSERGLVYVHNCRPLAKGGYEDTGPNAIAVGIEVTRLPEPREPADNVPGQPLPYKWAALGLVGQTTLHLGPDCAPDLSSRLKDVLAKHLALMDRLDCQAAVRAERDKAVAKAGAEIRKGLLQLAGKFPQLGRPDELERALGKEEVGTGRVRIFVTREPISKGGRVVGSPAAAKKDRYSVLVILQPRIPGAPVGQRDLSPVYPDLGLEGMVHAQAGDPALDQALKQLVADALAPLKRLDERPAASPAPHTTTSGDDRALERLRAMLGAVKPRDWEILPLRKGQVAPAHWPKGEGTEIVLRQTQPGPKGRASIGVWIMDRSYDAARPAGGPYQRPGARELKRWRGRRAFAGVDMPQSWLDWAALEKLLAAGASDAAPQSRPATGPRPAEALSRIRRVDDVFASLKAGLVRLSAEHAELAGAGDVAVEPNGVSYSRNCRYMGKRGYEDTGPKAMAIAIEVMTVGRYQEQVRKVAMQMPGRRWDRLGLVGWATLHLGKDIPPALSAKLAALLEKHLAMIDDLDRRAPGSAGQAGTVGAAPAPPLGEQRRVAIAREVAAAFAQAVKEHAAGYKPRPPGAGGPSVDWSLVCHDDTKMGGKALNRSAAMDALVAKMAGHAAKADQAEINAYVTAAGEFLSHAEAPWRAVACELLYRFPRQTVELGLVPAVGRLLDDGAIAFEGADIWLRSVGPAEVTPGAKLTVAEIAQRALSAATSCVLPNGKVFQTWWQHNKDYRRRLWYWALRWRTVKPERDLAGLADLEPREALKILLLVGNNPAGRRESLLGSPSPEELRKLPFPKAERPAPYYHLQTGPKPQTIADFVRKHSLKGVLMEVLRQTISWPEVQEGSEEMSLLLHTSVPVMALVFDRSDAVEVQRAATNLPDNLKRFRGLQESLRALAAALSNAPAAAPAARSAGEGKPPHAREPAAEDRPLDLDSTAKLLAQSPGGKWTRRTRSGISALVQTPPGQPDRAEIYQVFPFPFDDAGRNQVQRFNDMRSAPYHLLGASDQCTVIAYVAEETADVQAIRKALRLPTPAVSLGAYRLCALLMADLESFSLTLEYHGKQTGAPMRNLRLSTTAEEAAAPSGPWVSCRISRTVQATAIIEHLRDSGMLNPPISLPAGSIRGPCYVLAVRAGDTAVTKDLGWGLGMLARLDALRKVLDGDAAKAMDGLMAPLEPRRKEWEGQLTRNFVVQGLKVGQRGQWPVAANVHVPGSRFDEIQRKAPEIRDIAGRRLAGLGKEDIELPERRRPVEADILRAINEKVGPQAVRDIHLQLDIK